MNAPPQEFDVVLPAGPFSYSCSSEAYGTETWSSSASLHLKYLPNSQPNATWLNGLSVDYTLGARATVVASASDPDSNLSGLQICALRPDGVTEVLVDWPAASLMDPAAYFQREFLLPVFSRAGVYTLWVRARDVNGTVRDPKAQGIEAELYRCTVGTLTATDANGNGLDDVWERQLDQTTDAAARPLADDDADGLSNIMEFHLGTNP